MHTLNGALRASQRIASETGVSKSAWRWRYRRPKTPEDPGRSYDEALRYLALLQSNRDVTKTFDKPKAPLPTTGSRRALNAKAIPEMIVWLQRAGYTTADLATMRHIHVAGTKGKGSVCAYATNLLTRLKEKDSGSVGTYTSPHLVSPRERIAIDGAPISQKLFASEFFKLWDRFSEVAKIEAAVDRDVQNEDFTGPETKPFYFRFLTILAWQIFLNHNVKHVVMECGIGGEYDSTNVLPPEAVSAAVITQLDIDHTAMLGKKIKEIAWHKAGILKTGVRGFVRDQRHPPGTMDVIRARAAEKQVELMELSDEDVEKWGGVEGRLQGDFQKYNQALAAMAVQEHLGIGTGVAHFPLPLYWAKTLKKAKVRGRCQIYKDDDKVWLLDGAHTKQSLTQSGGWVANLREKFEWEHLILVFNQQEQDRDASELLDVLLRSIEWNARRQSIVQWALFTRNELEKPAEGETRDMTVQHQLAETMSREIPGGSASERILTFDNLEDTVKEARKLADETGYQVLVTGSMHLVGGVLKTLNPEQLK